MSMTLPDITPQWNASDQMRMCLMAKNTFPKHVSYMGNGAEKARSKRDQSEIKHYPNWTLAHSRSHSVLHSSTCRWRLNTILPTKCSLLQTPLTSLYAPSSVFVCLGQLCGFSLFKPVSQSATKCSILQTLLTSLHAPCDVLRLTVLQLNAANATTYQKAPPIGRATKSQKRHDFDNWVYLVQTTSNKAQS